MLFTLETARTCSVSSEQLLDIWVTSPTVLDIYIFELRLPSHASNA